MTDETKQIIKDLMDMVWYLRSNASETTPFGKHDREQAERLYRRADAFLTAAGGCPECEKLKKSLEFYANAENWKEGETGIGMIPGDAIDYGATARKALEGWSA